MSVHLTTQKLLAAIVLSGGASVMTWGCDIARGTARWTCWIGLVLLLSSPVVVDVAAASVPSFLRLDGLWQTALHMGIGGYQAVASAFVIPILAEKAVGGRKPSLVSMSCALSNWVIPSLAVLYLNWACYDQWIRWWPECAQWGA